MGLWKPGIVTTIWPYLLGYNYLFVVRRINRNSKITGVSRQEIPTSVVFQQRSKAPPFPMNIGYLYTKYPRKCYINGKQTYYISLVANDRRLIRVTVKNNSIIEIWSSILEICAHVLASTSNTIGSIYVLGKPEQKLRSTFRGGEGIRENPFCRSISNHPNFPTSHPGAYGSALSS